MTRFRIRLASCFFVGLFVSACGDTMGLDVFQQRAPQKHSVEESGVRRGRDHSAKPKRGQVHQEKYADDTSDLSSHSLRQGQDTFREDDIAIARSGGELARNWGVVLPLSGTYGSMGNSILKGIRLAIEESSATGVELVVADDQGVPENSVAEYRRLATEKRVGVVLGPLLANSTDRLRRAAKDYLVPFISFSKKRIAAEGEGRGSDATNRSSSSAGSFFRIGITPEEQVASLVDFSSAQGCHDYAVVYTQNTSTIQDFVELFRRYVDLSGGQIVWAGKYVGYQDAGLVDEAAEDGGLWQSSFDCVFLPDSLDVASDAIVAMRAANEGKVLILGTASWNEPRILSSLGDKINDIVFVSPFNSFSSQEDVQKFAQLYRSKYDESPEMLSALGYDTVKMVLSLCGDKDDSIELSNCLNTVNGYKGVTGKFRSSGLGDIDRRLSIVQFSNGELVDVTGR